MAYIQADRVQETTTTTGTGTVTLAGAVTGYRTFASQMVNGDTCYYVIVDPATGAWETGIGTYSSSTLARTTLLDSSTGSAVSFAAGTKNVLMAPVAKGALLKVDTVTCQGGAATAATLWGDITSGSITIGGSLTSGDLRLGATAQSGAVIVQANQLYFGSANLQQMIFTGGATNHSLEMGRQDGTASTPYIDFHSGATAVDYDTRLLATSGNGTSGNGDLTTYAKNVTLSGPSGSSPAFNVESVQAAGYYPAYIYMRRMGAGSTATPSNTPIGQITWDGRNSSSGYDSFASISANVGTVGASGTPTSMDFFTNTGSGQQQALKLDFDQTVRAYGPFQAPAATSSIPSLRIPHGAAPSSPTNGDFYTTSAGGLFGYINGVTLNYTAVYFGSSAPSNPALQPVWFNTSDGGLYVYNSSTWVDVGGGSIINDSSSSSSTVYSSSKIVSTYAPLASPTFTGKITLPTGSASGAPLKFTAGTVATTLVDGVMEYDGDRLTFTKSTAAGRALVQARQMLVASGNSSAATTTTLVSPFGTSNDTLTLEAGKIYRFKGKYHMVSTFTSGTANVRLAFAFSQTVQSIKYTFRTFVETPNTVVLANTRVGTITAVAATQVTPNITGTITYVVEFEGFVTTNASTGGTITPQFSMSTTGSSTVCAQYSWFEIENIGPAATVVIAGAWS